MAEADDGVVPPDTLKRLCHHVYAQRSEIITILGNHGNIAMDSGSDVSDLVADLVAPS